MPLVDDIRAAQSPDMDFSDMEYRFDMVKPVNWEDAMYALRDIVDDVPKIAAISFDDSGELVIEVIATA